MKIGQMMSSKYVKKDDVDPALLVTFSRFSHENVAQENQPEELKWVAYFEEMDKGLVLNSTNLQLAAQALGSDDTDDWIGHQVVLYNDPNVSFGGKLTGGVRIRAPKKTKPAPKPVKPTVPLEEMDDDIPF
jgi:ribosomal protein L24E